MSLPDAILQELQTLYPTRGVRYGASVNGASIALNHAQQAVSMLSLATDRVAHDTSEDDCELCDLVDAARSKVGLPPSHSLEHHQALRLLSTALATDMARALVDLAWQKYNESDRYYHTFGHAVHVMETCVKLFQRVPMGQAARCSVLVAALFHDAVYEAGAPRGENEKRSATVALEACAMVGLDLPSMIDVERLIMLTVGHATDFGDVCGMVLIDADLSTFAVEDYDQFVGQNEAIRKEYAHVSDEDWNLGRRGVLEHFLYRDPMYYVLDDDAVDRATLNIVRAIRELPR